MKANKQAARSERHAVADETKVLSLAEFLKAITEQSGKGGKIKSVYVLGNDGGATIDGRHYTADELAKRKKARGTVVTTYAVMI